MSEIFSKSLGLVRSYSSGISIEVILKEINGEKADHETVNSIASRIKNSKNYPDTIHGLFLFMNGLNNRRKEIAVLYEGAMEKYGQINSKLNKASGHTDDEIKIKGTLSDYIIKMEALFESHDRGDDKIIKNLSTFLNESNLHGKTDIEILYMNLPSNVMSGLVDSLEQYANIYQFYDENREILQRLINISNLILESKP